MMNGAKAYAKVGLETGITSASPHGLIIMLYDGAIDSIRKAKIHMENKDIEMKVLAVDKALKIIGDGLNGSVDLEAGGEIAERLSALYSFISKQLIQANAKNDAAGMDTCIELLDDLRSAWLEIGHTAAKS
jgi:flagellar secretion chaperone FliS